MLATFCWAFACCCICWIAWLICCCCWALGPLPLFICCIIWLACCCSCCWAFLSPFAACCICLAICCACCWLAPSFCRFFSMSCWTFGSFAICFICWAICLAASAFFSCSFLSILLKLFAACDRSLIA